MGIKESQKRVIDAKTLASYLVKEIEIDNAKKIILYKPMARVALENYVTDYSFILE